MEEMQVAIPDSAEKQIITAYAIIDKVQEVVIENDHQLESATSLRSWLVGTEKKLEDERTAVTGPINQALKVLNSRFKAISEPLVKAKRDLSDKIRVYMEAQERVAREEAEKKAAGEQERLIRQAEAFEKAGDTDAAEGLLETAVATVASEVTSNIARGTFGGSASLRSSWDAELDPGMNPNLALSLVPEEYLLPPHECVNWKVVRAAVSGKSGKREIPGLRVFEKKTVTGR